MGWQFSYNYILNLNYYWERNLSHKDSEFFTPEQPLILLLKSCILLDIKLNSNLNELERIPANIGTIIGWDKVNPSPGLENLSLSPDEWLHLFFDIGGNNKIEALCQSIVIKKLAKQSLAMTS